MAAPTLKTSSKALMMTASVAGSAALLIMDGAPAGVVSTFVVFLPIAFAGLLWGWRGLAAGIPMVASVSLLRLTQGAADAPLHETLASTAVMLAAAAGFAALGEWINACRDRSARLEETNRRMFEHSFSGVCICRQGRLAASNSRFARMLGCEKEELASRFFIELVHPGDQADVEELLDERCVVGDSELSRECRFVRPSGDTVWAELSCVPISHEDRPAVLVHAHDITSRKEAERKRRELVDLTRRQEEQIIHSTRLAELGEIAAAIAHEMNQPLTGIKGYAANCIYMMETATGSAEEIKRTLGHISEQVDRASRFINQMRELTKTAELRLEELDLNQVVRDSFDFLSPQFRLAGVEAHFEPDPGLPKVLGDRVRLEQVFLNLLNNARQAMAEAKQKVLRVRTRLISGGDLPVVAEVSDTGVGFTKDVEARLFVPFFSTKKSGSGTGLGLSTSLGIAQEHGGTIDAVSGPRGGATFAVRLPLSKTFDRARAKTGVKDKR